MEKQYRRALDLVGSLEKKSHFLFGARATGKSTLIEKSFPEMHYFDLLDNDLYERLLRDTKLIEQVVGNSNKPIIIDEIQRLPKLLNEVQRLMKSIPNKFLLTGSSARKLKTDGANLLGGRAWEINLHPLTYLEIDGFNLLMYLNRGGLPHVYLSEHPRLELKNYVNLYLREEIIAEAYTRKIEYFISFLDAIALTNGEELHFQGLSNDCGVPARTIQNYVQILEDTLLGFQLKPFQKTKKRKAIARSKFFIFDLGVTNHLAKRGEIIEGSETFGKAFEHFIIREIKSRLSYLGSEDELYYWRSTSQFEVDLIVGQKMAIEIKASKNVKEAHLRGLKALREEGLVKDYYLISNDKITREIDGIKLVYWQDFFKSHFSHALT